MNWAYLVAFGAAFVLALALVPLARAVARRYGILDRPNTLLKKHGTPVAYLGGAAVFGAFLVALVGTRAVEAALYAAGGELPAWGALVFAERGGDPGWAVLLREGLTLKGLRGVVLGGFVLLVVGTSDDVRPLGPGPKFLLQFAAAALLVATGKHIRAIEPLALALVLTALWVTAVTNAWNFIDIQNGLASGTALVACGAFFVVGSATGKYFDMTLAAALAGAILGFLPYNFPRASIFLGDAGSLFLGFSCAALAIGETYTRVNTVAVLSPLLILIVPLFDMIFTMAMRWRAGKAVYRGSPDHVALRLVRAGLSPRVATTVLWACGALGGGLAALSCRLTGPGAVVLYSLVAVPVGAAALWLGRRKLDP